jgi:hypothetical protein
VKRALLLLCLGSVACNSVLELDEAYVDPSIAASRAGSAAAPETEAGASGAGGAGADASAEAPCQQYCRVITESCVGEEAQYTDLDACLAACPLFPEGTAGDTVGNSLGCRLTQALRASSEPVTYCTWAGPGGDGQCGSNCEGFCTLMAKSCTPTTTSAPSDYFPSPEECVSTCAGLPTAGPYCATSKSVTSGNSLQCRLYHVAAGIYADDSYVHCPHAMGLSLCVQR